jgi:hypothetical protein
MIDPIYTLNSPGQIYRSSMFSFRTIIYFGCNFTYTQINQWLLNRVDIVQTIDLTSNPTSNSPELVMKANSLAYGTYEFIYQVNINVPSMNSGGSFTSSISTFVQIVPTGLAIFALKNGISTILIGYGQTQVLDPTKYSFDFDNVASISTLSYKYYCVTILTTLSDISSSSIDLATYKSNPLLSMSSNQTCFASSGKELF